MYKRNSCQHLFRKSSFSFSGIELARGQMFVRKSNCSFGGFELAQGGLTSNVSA